MTPHRTAPPPGRTALQALLDGDAADWVPRPGEPWEDFVRRKAPPEPSVWQFLDRGKYRAALAEALRQGERHVSREALLLPFWFGNNEDEGARDDVWERHLVLWSEGEALLEREHVAGPPFWARLELIVTSGAVVALGRNYAPGIPVLRFGPYAVITTIARIRIEVLESCDFGPAEPAPTST